MSASADMPSPIIARLPASQLPPGGQTLVRAEGVQVAVFRLETGALHAVDNACPHEGYPLHQGSVKGCVLTCLWHNFKFDLTDGSCLKGDEAVTTYPVREVDGQIEVEIVLPPVAERRARALRSLDEGVSEMRLGQAAREVVRLLELGMASEALVLHAAHYDAEYAEYGISHAMPVAADILGLLPRYPDLDAVYPLMQAFDMCAGFHARRDKRPVADPVDPGDDAVLAGDTLLAHVEAEEVAAAEALLRGALARGWDRATIEPWFYRANTRHFIGFGHGLIYTTKAFDLLDAVGWEHADKLLPGVLVSIISQTREELLPEWHWFRRRLEAVAPRLEALHALGGRAAPASNDPGALLHALVDGTREEAFDAVTDALERGCALDAIVDALSVAASERLLRFDHEIDADHTIQNSWLTVTHILTYVNAVRSALTRFDSPDLLHLLYFAARQVQHHEALDLPLEARLGDRGSVRDAVAACRTRLEHAVRAGDAQQAMDALAGFVHGGGEVTDLRPFCEDLTLQDARVTPIRVAHLLKTSVAAFDEVAALSAANHPGALRPLQAFLRFAASPMRERNLQARSYEAIRFIVYGKVPRTLA